MFSVKLMVPPRRPLVWSESTGSFALPEVEVKCNKLLDLQRPLQQKPDIRKQYKRIICLSDSFSQEPIIQIVLYIDLIYQRCRIQNHFSLGQKVSYIRFTQYRAYRLQCPRWDHPTIGTIADLALYPIFLLIRTPSHMSECWQYIRFGTISDGITNGTVFYLSVGRDNPLPHCLPIIAPRVAPQQQSAAGNQ